MLQETKPKGFFKDPIGWIKNHKLISSIVVAWAAAVSYFTAKENNWIGKRNAPIILPFTPEVDEDFRIPPPSTQPLAEKTIESDPQPVKDTGYPLDPAKYITPEEAMYIDSRYTGIRPDTGHFPEFLQIIINSPEYGDWRKQNYGSKEYADKAAAFYNTAYGKAWKVLDNISIFVLGKYFHIERVDDKVTGSLTVLRPAVSAGGGGFDGIYISGGGLFGSSRHAIPIEELERAVIVRRLEATLQEMERRKEPLYPAINQDDMRALIEEILLPGIQEPGAEVEGAESQRKPKVPEAQKGAQKN